MRMTSAPIHFNGFLGARVNIGAWRIRDSAVVLSVAVPRRDSDSLSRVNARRASLDKAPAMLGENQAARSNRIRERAR